MRKNYSYLEGTDEDVADDLLDHPEEVCRDERCPIQGVHRRHDVYDGRGKMPLSCPGCKQPIKRGQGPICGLCGWDKRLERFTPPRVKKDILDCPVCRGNGEIIIMGHKICCPGPCSGSGRVMRKALTEWLNTSKCKVS